MFSRFHNSIVQFPVGLNTCYHLHKSCIPGEKILFFDKKPRFDRPRKDDTIEESDEKAYERISQTQGSLKSGVTTL